MTKRTTSLPVFFIDQQQAFSQGPVPLHKFLPVVVLSKDRHTPTKTDPPPVVWPSRSTTELDGPSTPAPRS